MRVRCFTVEPQSERPNGNSLRPEDWALVSYRNDIFEMPDDAGAAAITRQLGKYMDARRRFVVYVREDSPNYAHEIVTARVPVSRRTKALKLWCLGHINIHNDELREG